MRDEDPPCVREIDWLCFEADDMMYGYCEGWSGRCGAVGEFVLFRLWDRIALMDVCAAVLAWEYAFASI